VKDFSAKIGLGGVLCIPKHVMVKALAREVQAQAELWEIKPVMEKN
jgi:hypothetical protein